MPKLISIAVESPGRYVVIDSESHVWRGQGGQMPGAPPVIIWELVTCDFPASRRPAKVSGAAEDELGP